MQTQLHLGNEVGRWETQFCGFFSVLNGLSRDKYQDVDFSASIVAPRSHADGGERCSTIWSNYSFGLRHKYARWVRKAEQHLRAFKTLPDFGSP